MKHCIKTYEELVRCELMELFGNFSDFQIYRGSEPRYKNNQEIDWQLLTDGPPDKVNLVSIVRMTECIELDKVMLRIKRNKGFIITDLLYYSNMMQHTLNRLIRQLSKNIVENDIQFFQSFPLSDDDNSLVLKNNNGIFLQFEYDHSKWSMQFYYKCLFAFATQEMLDKHKRLLNDN